ncbi:MAG: M24 family metallopeptidase [Bacteroidia bacterium]
MTEALQHLIHAEQLSLQLFSAIEERGLIVPGKSEKELNNEVYKLAEELLGVKKFWHKRIVRSGPNTLLPYRENPPDLLLKHDDILFFDFGPILEDWEADIGKTYVIGNDIKKHQLKRDTEEAWNIGRDFYLQHKDHITGAEFYAFTQELAKKFGWTYGNEHCGHLIGKFPHEKISGEIVTNYIHPDNHEKMSKTDRNGQTRYWIYEIHFTDPERKIGGFFEKMMY